MTTKQLAIMGATLAYKGVNPKSGKRLLDEQYVLELLAIMLRPENMTDPREMPK